LTLPLSARQGGGRRGKMLVMLSSEGGSKKAGVRVDHKPSSVPMPWAPVMIIPLGRKLPHASSDLPGSLGRATLKRSPIWSCSGWGLPSRPGHPSRWWSLTPPFHPCLCLDTSGYARESSACRPSAVYSLWHSPSGHPAWALPSNPLCGARTFLRLQLWEPAII
jgi:hypothetical protein